MPTKLVIQSDGIFHGLPTYDSSGLQPQTALVAGATGLSGYHMVRVLAASPQRWSKIYCLSSRPPPDNFFADLGDDGLGRVEHLQVDFLSEPPQIAGRLKEKIQRVYVPCAVMYSNTIPLTLLVITSSTSPTNSLRLQEMPSISGPMRRSLTRSTVSHELVTANAVASNPTQ